MIDWKSIPKQTIFGFGEPGSTSGDCWRCCVAALVNRPASEVPHFVAQAKAEDRHAVSLTNAWLTKNGYWFIDLVEYSSVSAPRHSGDEIAPIPYMAVGVTVRSKNDRQTHVVVMILDKVVYDPHPSEAGLLAITQRYLVAPIPEWLKDMKE